MDFWTYPVGTTAWKEFTRNGVRVETRMLRKKGPATGDWTMIAYRWNSDQRDAVAVPAGSKNANGTPHDIPAQKDCLFCHGNMKDVLLGLTAIQLSHSKAGLRIDDLIEEKRLTAPPSAPIQIPGDPVAEGALGYLHANCGLCHNSQAKVAQMTPLRLWESTLKLDSVATTLGYETTVGAKNTFLPELHVIEPGRPDESELVIRISERGTRQMPPIATEVVDEEGVAKIRAWVESITVPDAGIPDAGRNDAGISDGSVSDAGLHDASIADGGAGASPAG
jgi:mono/diheme cytochrome c family protein